MQTQRRPRVLAQCTLTLAIALSISPPALSLRGVNFLGLIQGEVYIRRLVPNRANTGDLVQTNQTLRVGPNSRVTLICNNHTSHLLTPGIHSVGDYCPEPPQRSPTSRNRTREIFDKTQPYLLSPRNTALLSSESLLIQWHQQSDLAPSLPTQLSVTGADVDWQTETVLGEVPYQGPQAFKPDWRYTITVTVGDQSSQASFTVLPPSERDRVNQEVATLQALNLEPDSEAIGLALIYLNYHHSDPDRHSNSLNLDALHV